MAGNKIKYTCKNCGWDTSIRGEWPDLKPKRCMARRCNTNFEKDKDALLIQLPEKVEEVKTEPGYRSRKNRKNDEQ